LRLAQRRDQVGESGRDFRIGDDIRLPDCGRRGKHKAQRGDEITDAEQRAAVDEILDRQRPARERRAQQHGEISFHAWTVKQDRPQDCERNAGRAHRRFGGELRTAIGVGRRRRVALR